MSERLHPNHRQEHEPALKHHEAEHQKEQLGRELEQKAEHAERHKQSIDSVRQRVEQEAISGKEFQGAQTETHQEDEYVSKQDKAQTFQQTMRRVQGHEGPVARVFSRFMHQPVVERVSDGLGKTIARPSGILGGGLSVCLGLGYVLFVANRVGFTLSGSEFIILLAFGWVMGLLIEFLLRNLLGMFRR